VTGRVRRRRALLLLSLALASGGLAASQVRGTVQRVEARVGAPVPVVVARRDLPPDARLAPGDLAVREVPGRYAPRDAFDTPAQAAGARTAVALPAGGYVTAGSLRGASSGRGGRALRRGERAVEVSVAGGEALAVEAGPGAQVDVLVSSEAGSRGGRTVLALEDVELLGLRAGGGGGRLAEGEDAGASAAATAVATLRVTVRQAVYLTAAQSFAREVRLLPRPPGEPRRGAGAAVSAGDL
jgi:pilus assembly protein CpaB